MAKSKLIPMLIMVKLDGERRPLLVNRQLVIETSNKKQPKSLQQKEMISVK